MRADNTMPCLDRAPLLFWIPEKNPSLFSLKINFCCLQQRNFRWKPFDTNLIENPLNHRQELRPCSRWLFEIRATDHPPIVATSHLVLLVRHKEKISFLRHQRNCPELY